MRNMNPFQKHWNTLSMTHALRNLREIQPGPSTHRAVSASGIELPNLYNKQSGFFSPNVRQHGSSHLIRRRSISTTPRRTAGNTTFSCRMMSMATWNSSVVRRAMPPSWRKCSPQVARRRGVIRRISPVSLASMRTGTNPATHGIPVSVRRHAPPHSRIG